LRIGTALESLRSLHPYFGCRTLSYKIADACGRRGLVPSYPVRAELPGFGTFEIRTASSDFDVFRQVLLDCEYGNALKGIRNVRTVLDVGANAGYAAIYFLNTWDCEVVAIEPDPQNAALCRRNLAPYGRRARVVEAALWSSNDALALHDIGTGAWGIQVKPAANGSVRGITIRELLEMTGGSADVLKLDIEGAEREVFAGDTSWLDCVRNVVLELHGPECEAAFDSAMLNYDCERREYGELTACLNVRRYGT